MNELLLPELRVGDPTTCGALSLYPLYPERTLFTDSILDYMLSAEAQESGSCIVAEMSEPNVGELLIENTGDRPVLFLEGEELVGAKQNRIMRSSVLIPAGSRVAVPVFCVERGRWDSSSGNLKSGSHAPPSLRRILKGGSNRPGIFGRGDRQTVVWRYIAAKHAATGTRSPKGNMTDALRSHPEVVKELRQELRYPEGALGIAVTINGRTVGIDMFDKPESLQKVWDRLVVLGLTLDALDLRDADRQDDDQKPVRVYMEGIREMCWREFPTVGLGKMYRATDSGSLATALVVDGTLLHLSMSIPDRKQGD